MLKHLQIESPWYSEHVQGTLKALALKTSLHDFKMPFEGIKAQWNDFTLLLWDLWGRWASTNLVAAHFVSRLWEQVLRIFSAPSLFEPSQPNPPFELHKARESLRQKSMRKRIYRCLIVYMYLKRSKFMIYPQPMAYSQLNTYVCNVGVSRAAMATAGREERYAQGVAELMGCDLVELVELVELGSSPARHVSATFQWFPNDPVTLSMDWFKGEFTGIPHIEWENLWFPVDFPLNQSIDIMRISLD